MDNGGQRGRGEGDGEGRNDAGPPSSTYRLFGGHTSIHQMTGGGRATDVILWKSRYVACAIIVVATVAWLLFVRAGLSFLTICSNVLLILIVLLFLRANYADFRNIQLQTLPELVLSEEMVNSAAAAFRVKINSVLLMAHDITLGKDFRLFFKESLYQLQFLLCTIDLKIKVDRYASFIHQKISRHYKFVDGSVISRLPRSLSKDKDS